MRAVNVPHIAIEMPRVTTGVENDNRFRGWHGYRIACVKDAIGREDGRRGGFGGIPVCCASLCFIVSHYQGHISSLC